MNIYTYLVISALILGMLLQLWLLSRHAHYVARHRDAVPAPFRDYISLDAHQKAADYTVAKTQLARIEEIINALLLVFWTVGGGINALDYFWSVRFNSKLWLGTIFILSITMLMSILDLPLAIYRTFVLEKKFGFNRTTPKTFIIDLIKQIVLSIILGTPLIWVILWFMDSAGAAWWLYAWGTWLGFGLLMTWAYPNFIAPLFNKFTPLNNEELKQQIVALIEKCGFRADGVYVMDGSRRSSHGNAYFTGFGKHKRIVFFDTLIELLSPSQIEAVLAHELGHFHHRHIIKRWLLIGTMSLIGFAILGYLAQQNEFYWGLGVDKPTAHTALILFSLVAPLFTLFAQPLLSHILRKHEFEADHFSRQITNHPNALREALLNLYRENAGTLTPDPIYSAFYDSHPPAAIRIAHILADNS